MAIDLAELPDLAAADYLDTHVSITVSEVTRHSGSCLRPNERGTFTVSVHNDGPPHGVRLVNLRFHVLIGPAAVAKLVVPGGALLTAHTRPSVFSTLLDPGRLVDDMIVFPTATTGALSSTLDSGQRMDLVLDVKAVNVGDANIMCHVHTDIGEFRDDGLFPAVEQSRDGRRRVRVTASRRARR